jgi:hypothetical protein
MLSWVGYGDFMDCDGKDVVLFGRTREMWLAIKACESNMPSIRYTSYHDPAGFAALVFASAKCCMQARGDACVDDMPFVRDFVLILRERVFFGYVQPLHRWFERCLICVDNYGFFQCDQRILNASRIRVGMWEDGRKPNNAGLIQASDEFAIQHMRTLQIED